MNTIANRHGVDSLPSKPATLNQQGIRELQAFRDKYESKWSVKPEIFPYTDGHSVKVYELNCEGRCFTAAFDHRVSTGKEISKKDFAELVDLLENPESYDNHTAACFDPKIGVIVYDEEGVPMEYLAICLGCNNYETYPGSIQVELKNEHRYGFSNEARNKLRKIFRKWGIDYYGFSPLFDDEQAYEEYLETRDQ